MSILGGIISGGLSLIGGERRNKAQTASAKAQMEFQERMSNTSHQRQVKDLRLAGLNPILSAKLGGATTPGGAMPNITNPIETAVASGRETMRVSAANKLMEAQMVSAQESAKSIAIKNKVDGYYADLLDTPEGQALHLSGSYNPLAVAGYGVAHSAKNAAQSFALKDNKPFKGNDIQANINKLNKNPKNQIARQQIMRLLTQPQKNRLTRILDGKEKMTKDFANELNAQSRSQLNKQKRKYR